MTDDEDLRREVQRLREEVTALQRRLEALEESGTEPGPRTDETAEPALDRGDVSTPVDADVSGSERGEESAPPAEPAGDHSSASADPATGPGSPDESSRDWEETIGIRWLGVAGGLALVVGVVFFVRLAIDRGLLGPPGRVTVGTLGGLLLVAGGRFADTRQGYVRWGRITAGVGLAVAYFSLYAAYGFETYRKAIGTPLWAVLAALTLLVAGTALVSVRDGAPLVAGEAFLFGYVTAYLSTGAATLVVTPVYALLLAGGLVAIATVRPWSRLVVGSVFATYGVLGFWAVDLDPPEGAVVVVAAAAFLTHLAGSYVLRGWDRLEDRTYRGQLAWLVVLNGGLGALFLEVSVRGLLEPDDAAGFGTALVAVALALFYFLTDYVADRRSGGLADGDPVPDGGPRADGGSAPDGGAAGRFGAVIDRGPVRKDQAAAAASVVVLAAALQQAFGIFATTAGMLAIIAGAVALARWDDAPAFRAGSHVVAAALAVKLVVVDAWRLPPFDASAPVETLTGRPVAFALSVAVLYALAWWFTVDESSLLGYERGERFSIGGLYAVVATGLAVVALGLELSGVSISIAWALFGVALLGIGFYADVRGIRLLGIAVLALATAKVFLYDTTDLDALSRTLSFVALGVVLLVASYAYARFRGGIEVGLGLRDTDREPDHDSDRPD